MSEEKTYGATKRGFINFLTKHSQLAYIMTIVLLVILLFTYINYSLSHIQIQRSDLSALITIDTADGKDISKHILEEDFPATIQEPVVVSTFTWDDQDWNITVTPREHQRAVETAYFIRFILGLIIILIICWFTIKLLQQVLNLKKRAKTLLDKEREYRSLSDNSPDVIIRYDKDLRHTYISPALKTYTGLDTEQLIGKTLEEITRALWDLEKCKTPHEAGVNYIREAYNEERIIEQLTSVFNEVLCQNKRCIEKSL